MPQRALNYERKRTGEVDELLTLTCGDVSGRSHDDCLASGVANWRPLPTYTKLPKKLTPWEPGMARGAYCEVCYRDVDINAACARRFPPLESKATRATVPLAEPPYDECGSSHVTAPVGGAEPLADLDGWDGLGFSFAAPVETPPHVVRKQRDQAQAEVLELMAKNAALCAQLAQGSADAQESVLFAATL